MAPVTILAFTNMCFGSADHRFCLYLDRESWHSSVVCLFYFFFILFYEALSMLLSLFAMNAKKCYHPTKESCKRAQHIILLILNNGRVNVCHLYPTQQPVHIQPSYVKNLPIFFSVFVWVISFKHNILSLFVRSVCTVIHHTHS